MQIEVGQILGAGPQGGGLKVERVGAGEPTTYLGGHDEHGVPLLAGVPAGTVLVNEGTGGKFYVTNHGYLYTVDETPNSGKQVVDYDADGHGDAPSVVPES